MTDSAESNIWARDSPADGSADLTYAAAQLTRPMPQEALRAVGPSQPRDWAVAATQPQGAQADHPHDDAADAQNPLLLVRSEIDIYRQK